VAAEREKLGAGENPTQGGCFVPPGLWGWIRGCEGPCTLTHPGGHTVLLPALQPWPGC